MGWITNHNLAPKISWQIEKKWQPTKASMKKFAYSLWGSRWAAALLICVENLWSFQGKWVLSTHSKSSQGAMVGAFDAAFVTMKWKEEDLKRNHFPTCVATNHQKPWWTSPILFLHFHEFLTRRTKPSAWATHNEWAQSENEWMKSDGELMVNMMR